MILIHRTFINRSIKEYILITWEDSLFFKDVTAASGTVAGYSGITGNTYCRGDVLVRR